MRINNLLINNNQNRILSFGSKNCPIEPFTIQTTKSPLFVEEMPNKDIWKTLNFEFDCLTTSVAAWEPYKNCSKAHRSYFLSYLGKFLKHCRDKNDGNSTILIAKDLNNDVKALFNLQSLDKSIIAEVDDPKTAYINDCFVDAQYRSQGVGQKIIDKNLKTADGRFSDILLTADNKAINFYKRVGFSALDTTNPEIKKVSDYILNLRRDRDCLTLMSKSLNPADPWWARMVKLIK